MCGILPPSLSLLFILFIWRLQWVLCYKRESSYSLSSIVLCTSSYSKIFHHACTCSTCKRYWICCFTSAHCLKVFYMVRYCLYYSVTKQSYVMLIVQCLEYHGGCLSSYFFLAFLNASDIVFSFIGEEIAFLSLSCIWLLRFILADNLNDQLQLLYCWHVIVDWL